MARINYYEFPNTVNAHTRYINGAVHTAGDCPEDRETCIGCPVCEYGWSECPQFKATEAEFTVGGITVTEAKRLLKEFGGIAWTDHCERDGCCFETTEITLKGNNSRFKYSHHL